MQIDMADVRNNLDHLLALLETEQEECIFITKQGKPIIKLSQLCAAAGLSKMPEWSEIKAAKLGGQVCCK